MITDSFDNQSRAIINPQRKEDAPRVDACILTFSHMIEKFVLAHYDCKPIGGFYFATGYTPIYCIEYKGKRFAFYKTYVGAPACVGTVEDTLAEIQCNKYIVFGGAGCLDKEIAHGRVMVPTEAYRDEGTSYHYAPAADYITIRNAPKVAAFMQENGIPYILGKTWTTDAFYRETVNNFEKHKADGCISVEMECAALAACAKMRNIIWGEILFTADSLADLENYNERNWGCDSFSYALTLCLDAVTKL